MPVTRWPLPKMQCAVPHDTHTLRKARRWVAYDGRLSSRERDSVARGLDRLETFLEKGQDNDQRH